VSNEEYITILSALGDIQAAVDAIGLGVERLCEDVLDEVEISPSTPEVDAQCCAGATPEIAPWVNDPHKRRVIRSSAMGELREAHAEDMGTDGYPPPPRGNPGAAAGVVVIAVVVALIVSAMVMLLAIH